MCQENKTLLNDISKRVEEKRKCLMTVVYLLVLFCRRCQGRDEQARSTVRLCSPYGCLLVLWVSTHLDIVLVGGPLWRLLLSRLRRKHIQIIGAKLNDNMDKVIVIMNITITK